MSLLLMLIFPGSDEPFIPCSCLHNCRHEGGSENKIRPSTLIVEGVNCQNVHKGKIVSWNMGMKFAEGPIIIYQISSSIRVTNESHLKKKFEIFLLYTSMHISSNCCPILLILWMTPDLLTIIYPRLLYIMEVILLKWTGIRRR